MAEKQKPQPRIVKRAAILINRPEDATPADIKGMAARILDDQKNDPEQYKRPAKPPSSSAKKSAPSAKAPKRKK